MRTTSYETPSSVLLLAVLAGCFAAGVFSPDKPDAQPVAPDSVYVHLDNSIRLYETSDLKGSADHAITPPYIDKPWHIEAGKKYLAIQWNEGLPVKRWIYAPEAAE